MKILEKKIETILSIGGGPIGAGWTSFFLSKGLKVKSYLHNRNEKEEFLQMVKSSLKVLLKKKEIKSILINNFVIFYEIEKLSKRIDFVQESAPEDLILKQNLYKKLDNLLPKDVIIASSTSGIKMTEIQKKMLNPERAIVAHPFNPPYLLKLVEISGGEKTSKKTINFSKKFFKELGKKPLIIKKEISGFIATRLQEALWREALHMISKDSVKPEQIDFALKHGPSLRLAIQGQCMAFHVACGDGGMAKNLDQFGPSLKLPWTRLKAPALTKKLRNTLVHSCEKMSKKKNYKTLSKERDKSLKKLLKYL
tara:strand:+ start:133 stop:1062 length:930 start_codon:yes stop_codon:yes gene_type:complete